MFRSRSGSFSAITVLALARSTASHTSTVDRERLRAALLRRVAPNTALSRKQLAAAIGRDLGTIERILQGRGAGSFETFCELVRFFRSRGDHRFAAEVLGESPTPTSVRRALDKIDELRVLIAGVPS